MTTRMKQTVCLLLALLLPLAPAAMADGRGDIDAKVDQALKRLSKDVKGTRGLLKDAVGVLVFPDIVEMSFGVGGQYGEGALRVQGKTVAYYATSGASFGLQAGARSKAEYLLFMDRQALIDFRNSSGWEVGVNGSVLLPEVVDANKGLSTVDAAEPVIGFILSEEGIMFDLSMEGGKISRIAR